MSKYKSYNDLIDNMLNSNDTHFVIHGSAGTGKTFLIRKFLESCPRRCLCVSPTAIAARTLGDIATTIHSKFNMAPTYQNIDDITQGRREDQNLKDADVLIIDEMSMVRIDVIAAIDTILRYQKHTEKPFGGIQLILLGDIFQLPPVIPHDISAAIQCQYGKDVTGYFFEYSPLYNLFESNSFEFVELNTNYRFMNDNQGFGDLLKRLRVGSQTTYDLELLTTKVIEKNIRFPFLLSTREAVRTYNKLYIAEKGCGDTFTVLPEYSNDGICTEEHPLNFQTVLRQGIRTLVTSRVGKHLVNGDFGTIIEIIHDSNKKPSLVKVKKNDIVIPVEAKEEDVYQVKILNKKRKLVAIKIIGSIKQFPLLPGYAMTIHRAQSQSFEEATVGFGSFVNGLGYVGISRVRTLDGLYLISKPLQQYFEERSKKHLITRFYAYMQTKAEVINDI